MKEKVKKEDPAGYLDPAGQLALLSLRRTGTGAAGSCAVAVDGATMLEVSGPAGPQQPLSGKQRTLQLVCRDGCGTKVADGTVGHMVYRPLRSCPGKDVPLLQKLLCRLRGSDGEGLFPPRLFAASELVRLAEDLAHLELHSDEEALKSLGRALLLRRPELQSSELQLAKGAFAMLRLSLQHVWASVGTKQLKRGGAVVTKQVSEVVYFDDDVHAVRTSSQHQSNLHACNYMPHEECIREGREATCLGRPVRLLSANGRHVGLHWAEDLDPPLAYEMTEEWEDSPRRLVHVWPHFWMGKNRLVRSMLNAIFGFYDRRIFARNTRATRLAGLEREEGRRFLAAHHLLGVGTRLPGGRRSSLYALRADGEVLAMALFGRVRRHRCEVLRFCTAAGLQVPGGLSKLMTAFLREHPEVGTLVTDVPRDMSVASGYLSCGWHLEDKLPPDHFPALWALRGGAEAFSERDAVLRVLGPDAAPLLQQAGEHQGRSFPHPLAWGNRRPCDVARRAALREAGLRPSGCGALRLALKRDRETRPELLSVPRHGHAERKAMMKMDSIDESKVTVYGACFCCFNGLNLENIEIGCAAKETLLCLEWDCCLKSNTEKLRCFCCDLRIVSPTVCIKQQGQLCCFVSAAAIPPDSEVPMMLSVCFLVCFPKVGFFKKISEIKG
ncbi:unnamed protein product [Symbiodinium natans]|uniref:Uncharacterized protein n=1 Tax=Symbiodinium natans TaxID=878477 RepID=A0A812L9B1_9DINO|nr:unnamed protein product [Symbiodinium natans]